MAAIRPWMTLKPGADGGLPVGAFMTEGRWQSQPTRPVNRGPIRGQLGANRGLWGPKLPLSGTHDTSLAMNDRDRKSKKPNFRRGGGKGPERPRDSGRRQ